MKKTVYTMLFLFVAAFSCTYDKGDIPVCDTVNSSYSQSVAPLIQTRCAISGCHNGSTYIGNFNNYTEVKMWVDNGIFKNKVVDMKTMPPTTEPPLTLQEYNILKCWCESGGPNN